MFSPLNLPRSKWRRDPLKEEECGKKFGQETFSLLSLSLSLFLPSLAFVKLWCAHVPLPKLICEQTTQDMGQWSHKNLPLWERKREKRTHPILDEGWMHRNIVTFFYLWLEKEGSMRKRLRRKHKNVEAADKQQGNCKHKFLGVFQIF